MCEFKLFRARFVEYQILTCFEHVLTFTHNVHDITRYVAHHTNFNVCTFHESHVFFYLYCPRYTLDYSSQTNPRTYYLPSNGSSVSIPCSDFNLSYLSLMFPSLPISFLIRSFTLTKSN